MGVVSTIFGSATAVAIVMLFFFFSKRFRLGALSLPCIALLTTLVYFYLMPAMALASGNDEYFGSYLTSLLSVHIVTALYLVGAVVSCALFGKQLNQDPTQVSAEKRVKWITFVAMWLVVIAGIFAQILIGKLSLWGESAPLTQEVENLGFLNVAYNVMLTLTLFYAVRERFSWKAIALLALVSLLFLQVGFRFRILIMLSASVCAFLLMRQIKLKPATMIVGACAAIILVNAIGVARSYGRGLDFTRYEGMSVVDLFSAYGGEVGIVFVTAAAADNPPATMVTVEPWTVGFSRLIPSLLWPEKPTASYLKAIPTMFSEPGADEAGIAAPQVVEMIMQFGWAGVPILAFLYFSLVAFLATRLMKLGYEGRVVGLSLIPAFFGYYMQTRGYFAQILADGIFIFGPLFILYARVRLEGVQPSVAPARTTRVPSRTYLPRSGSRGTGSSS